MVHKLILVTLALSLLALPASSSLGETIYSTLPAYDVTLGYEICPIPLSDMAIDVTVAGDPPLKEKYYYYSEVYSWRCN